VVNSRSGGGCFYPSCSSRRLPAHVAPLCGLAVSSWHWGASRTRDRMFPLYSLDNLCICAGSKLYARREHSCHMPASNEYSSDASCECLPILSYPILSYPIPSYPIISYPIVHYFMSGTHAPAVQR